MKRIITLLISAVMILTLCIPAFAAEAPKEETKEYYPVVGSWKLDTVYNVTDGQEPEEIKKEEAQSYYGTGISIYTFDEDGSAHDITFEGIDMVDVAAVWKTTSPNVYIYRDENGLQFTFIYDEEKDVLHYTFEDSSEYAVYKKLDYVLARAVVGSWKLDQVLEIHEGDAPVEMSKEENQSLYAEAENVLTFDLEGKVNELVKDGAEETTVEGTWEMPEPDKYVYTIDTLETEMEYFRVDDTLFRDVKTEGEYIYLRFIYVRTEDPEEAAQEEFDGGYAGYNYTDYDEDGTAQEEFDGGYAGYNYTDYDEDGTAQEEFDGGYAGYNYTEDEDNTEDRWIVDYKQDGTPVYNDDPSILYIDEDGFPRYALPEGSELVEDGDEPVIVDYKQDGTPVYSDDPSIVDFDQDGTPRYEVPEGSELVEDIEEPMVVDYMQDGTPVYSDDPGIVDFDQDGTPRYEVPEDSYLNDEG